MLCGGRSEGEKRDREIDVSVLSMRTEANEESFGLEEMNWYFDGGRVGVAAYFVGNRSNVFH